MSLGIWNLEWLNHNSQRAYPIMDSVNRRCTDDNNIKLPDDLILAVSFATHSGHAVTLSNFYIHSVVITGVGCSVYIGYGGAKIGVSHISVEGTDEVITSIITGMGDFDDTIGYIAINAKSNFLKATSGCFNFELENTRLCLDCIRPMLRSVSSLAIESAGAISDRIYGDVILQAGANILLTTHTSGNTTVITISALSQDYEDQCVCTDNADMPAIKTINGVSPDGSGNIALTGSDCMKVESSNSSVTISDTCAKPCCGCEELDALTKEIEKFANGKVTLETFLNQLISNFATIQAIVTASNFQNIEEE